MISVFAPDRLRYRDLDILLEGFRMLHRTHHHNRVKICQDKLIPQETNTSHVTNYVQGVRCDEQYAEL